MEKFDDQKLNDVLLRRLRNRVFHLEWENYKTQSKTPTEMVTRFIKLLDEMVVEEDVNED